MTNSFQVFQSGFHGYYSTETAVVVLLDHSWPWCITETTGELCRTQLVWILHKEPGFICVNRKLLIGTDRGQRSDTPSLSIGTPPIQYLHAKTSSSTVDVIRTIQGLVQSLNNRVVEPCDIGDPKAHSWDPSSLSTWPSSDMRPPP